MNLRYYIACIRLPLNLQLQFRRLEQTDMSLQFDKTVHSKVHCRFNRCFRLTLRCRDRMIT